MYYELVLKKISYFSRNQLAVLGYLLSQKERAVGASEIARKTKINGESLGGILSSLSRNNFRGATLITVWGRDEKGVGMRWRINESAVNCRKASELVTNLLRSYQV